MRTKLPALCSLAATLLLPVVNAAPLAPRSAGAPLYPPAGLDMTAIDASIRPGDDFFAYANGAWLARTAIPPDKPYMTEAQGIRDRTEAQLRALIEDAAARSGHAPASTEGKVGAFYKSYMDTPRIEALGRAPIEADLAAIRASRSRRARYGRALVLESGIPDRRHLHVPRESLARRHAAEDVRLPGAVRGRVEPAGRAGVA